jgi:hypothetical protein
MTEESVMTAESARHIKTIPVSTCKMQKNLLIDTEIVRLSSDIVVLIDRIACPSDRNRPSGHWDALAKKLWALRASLGVKSAARSACGMQCGELHSRMKTIVDRAVRATSRSKDGTMGLPSLLGLRATLAHLHSDTEIKLPTIV